MYKDGQPSMMIKWVLIQILVHCINTNEAEICNCFPTELGTQRKNITYGSSDEFKCRCQWTIPTSVSTDDKTAVVLLLQNASFSKDRFHWHSRFTGGIRFPGTRRYESDFPPNYCLAYATNSTICNIDKIKEKIGKTSNHTCNTLTTWDKVRRRQQEILYRSGYFGEYNIFFTIQYLPIDCRPSTTTEKSITQQSSAASMFANEKNGLSIPTANTTMAKILKTAESQKLNSLSSTITGILGAVIGLVVGIIIGVLFMYMIQRYRNKGKTESKDSTELEVTNQRSTEGTNYENYAHQMTDENGYEVPIQVYNKNEYESI